MTLPDERMRAVHNTREFLRSLLDRKATPKVPQAVREQAYWCLRHYPANYDMEKVCNKCPETFEMPESLREKE